MSIYLIGDVQGCDAALGRLLDTCGFSASRDTLVLLGDLVNRGPDSAAVLRRVMGLGASARSLLGNHDLHLLAVANGVRPAQRNDTLDGILQSAQREAILEWLRHQPLALRQTVAGEDLLMVHAGVLPAWSAAQTVALAAEVETVLRGPDWPAFLRQMYGNTPARWSEQLTGAERLRCIVNALTRLRFCNAEGEMEFAAKEGAATAPQGYMPWFDVPGRQTQAVTVAFGHWSTLGWLGRANLLSLDSGCVWGGQLSAVRLGTAGQRQQRELVQVPCAMAQQPGA
jgi:bis(5'-nucleosyl)-tetraphosphatase (symmetrical)